MPYPAPCYQHTSFLTSLRLCIVLILNLCSVWPQSFALTSTGYSVCCLSFIPVKILYILLIFQIHQPLSHSVVYRRLVFSGGRSFQFPNFWNFFVGTWDEQLNLHVLPYIILSRSHVEQKGKKSSPEFFTKYFSFSVFCLLTSILDSSTSSLNLILFLQYILPALLFTITDFKILNLRTWK